MSKKLTLIFGVLLYASCAFAQQDTALEESLEPVIVTANKLPQKQRTSGKVLTLITKEEIDKSAGKTLGQLLNEQVGITINGALNNPGTNQSLFMRGAAAGRTLILLDGIPVYDPSIIANEIDLNLFSLNNVECIEICKGAQSTLYGSDAVAGVVNIITTKPNINKPFQLKLNASAGNYGVYKASLDLSGKKGNISYGVKYSKVHAGGFSSAYDSSKMKSFEKDAYNSDMLNALLKWEIMPSLTWRTFAQYSHSLTDLDAAAFSDEKDYFFTNNAVIAGTGIHYTKNKVTLIANFQYSATGRIYTNDSADRPGSTKYSQNRFNGKAQFAEVYSKVDLGKGFSILHGADCRESSMSSTGYSLSSFGPFTSEFKDTSHSQASLYSSIFFNSGNEKLNIDLGGRINVHSQYGTNSTFTFNPSYSLNAHYRLLGSIASAFKAPTLYQLYSAYGNKSLQPEKSTTYEAGMEQRHEKISNRIVYFQRKIKEGIDFNYISFKYFNISKQVVRGVELESKARPTKQLFVSLNYTYLHTKEVSQSRITFKDTSYQYLLRRPKHTLNATLGYTFFNKAYASVSTKYISRRHDLGAYQKADVLLEDYLLLNAYAEYRFQSKIKLFADFQNITNTKFFDINGYNSIPFLFSTGVTVNL
jgi:vitamin B12 transporter